MRGTDDETASTIAPQQTNPHTPVVCRRDEKQRLTGLSRWRISLSQPTQDRCVFQTLVRTEQKTETYGVSVCDVDAQFLHQSSRQVAEPQPQTDSRTGQIGIAQSIRARVMTQNH